ncbi:MAG: FAD-dependent oxidoreductase, partial [Dehalococcoidia bacterium]|nr:FAD-dependent oxidoreductase [Dehalococcoidia bacterium]
TVPEIKEVIQAFGVAAARARDAGFDGAEVLGAHGYLVAEFMSPFFNRRKDEYGGNLENRLRFPLELLQAVRRAVGDDYTIGIRISGDEMFEGGLTLDDMVGIAPILASQGKVDYINVTMGTYRSPSVVIDSMYFPLGSALYCAAAIKAVVNVPVIGRGRVLDPAQAEQVLVNNQADLVGMARALIADPEIPNKAKHGKPEDIRTCLGCNECAGRVNYWSPMPLRCTTNASVSMESQPGWMELIPAARAKKVVVIGGGPAGMEMADIAARRGHKVTLYDKGTELGGAVLIAAKAPGRDGLLEAVRYRVHMLQADKVDVHLGVEMTARDIQKLGADVVVIATGSIPLSPDVVGLDGGNAIECRDLLTGKATAGRNVVVIAGEHHIQALTVADYLAGQGKKVELVCEEYYAGMHIDYLTRQAIYQRLYRQGVTLTPNSAVKEIRDNTVVVVNAMTREESVRDNIDTVVYACGGREDNALYYELQGKVKELYQVGDCSGVKRMIDAIRSASVLARRI